jgi:hypothetical protein
MDGAVEAGGLAAHGVDPLGRRDRAGEHGGLDLVDVAFDLEDDGRVRVHHRVQDRPEDRHAARGQQFRPLLQPLPDAGQIGRHPLPHRDHEGGRDKDADLAEVDLFVVAVIARGPHDDQLHVRVVAGDLRVPVQDQRVLDRQLVQPEGLADLGQLPLPGLEQPQPYEAAVGPAGRRLLQRHHPLFGPVAVLVVSTVDDHLVTPCPRRRRGIHGMRDGTTRTVAGQD